MAYNDDAVLARLSALNESHDSIATAAQWIMFHKRHADRTVQIWLQKLKESPSTRRLNLIYLANEVTQQSKARHKDDFPLAFAPIIAEAAAVAYKGATPDVQNKVRRVVEVWRDRAVFELPIQGAIETRIDDLDKARGVGKTGLGNSSIGGPAVPSELAPLVTQAQNVSKLALSLKAKTTNAEQEYTKNTDPKQPTPSAPVYAARLNGLLKTLATAEGAVAECVKARTELIGALEKLLDTNKASLEAEEKQLAELAERKSTIEQKKADVEMAIMRGLADQTPANRDGQPASPVPEPDRPEVEALTPPPIEDDTDMYNAQGTDSFEPVPAQEPATAQAQQPTGLETLSSLASQYSAVPVSTNGTGGANKRRKIDSADEIPDLGEDGIDPNIDEMIRQ
ncbi:RNA polymerase II-binding domain-containing protein [Diaporthe sp. PMI_573]|nr:RNA polymerase II-binding domain-containing protein [Diaporthaceae sp. PMI_573]